MNAQQKRNLLLFVAGRLISLVGSGIQMIAMPLYILDQTGSGTLMGVFSLLSMVPTLAASPLAGILGDRLNRKQIAVYTDVGRGLLIFILAWLAFTGRMNIGWLFGCQVLVSILDSLFNASTAAMLPDLTEVADYPRANAAMSGVNSLSMIIGPILGGIIYGFWGVKVVFMLNASSFIISAFCEALIVYRPVFAAKAKLTIRSSLGEIGEILTFITGQLGLRQLFIFAMLSNFLIAPVIMVGFPFIFKKVIGFTSQQYGYLMTTFMAGMLIGNLMLGSFLAKKKSGLLLRTGLLTQGILILGLMILFFPAIIDWFSGASWTLFGIIAAGFVACGVFNAFVNTPLNTNLQKMVPAEMRARFFAVLGLIAQLAVPVGSVIYGFLLDRLPAYLLLSVVGVLDLLVTVVFLRVGVPEAFEPKVEEVI